MSNEVLFEDQFNERGRKNANSLDMWEKHQPSANIVFGNVDGNEAKATAYQNSSILFNGIIFCIIKINQYCKPNSVYTK